MSTLVQFGLSWECLAPAVPRTRGARSCCTDHDPIAVVTPSRPSRTITTTSATASVTTTTRSSIRASLRRLQVWRALRLRCGRRLCRQSCVQLGGVIQVRRIDRCLRLPPVEQLRIVQESEWRSGKHRLDVVCIASAHRGAGVNYAFSSGAAAAVVSQTQLSRPSRSTAA